MKTAEELKPCPFCGGEAKIVGDRIQVNHSKSGLFYVKRCPQLPNIFYDFDVDVWNTRHQQDALATQSAEIAEQKNRIEELDDMLSFWKAENEHNKERITELSAALLKKDEALETVRQMLESDEGDSLHCNCGSIESEFGCKRCGYFIRHQNIVIRALSLTPKDCLNEWVDTFGELLKQAKPAREEWMSNHGFEEYQKLHTKAQQLLSSISPK